MFQGAIINFFEFIWTYWNFVFSIGFNILLRVTLDDATF